MGLLNSAFGLIQPKQVQPSDYSKNDFSDGLEITEVLKGKVDESSKLVLFGTFMPKDKFTHGGAQTVVKERYAGSNHPSVQVLGDNEDDVTISGTFNESHLTDKSLKGAAEEYEKRITQIRRSGNIVKVRLGDYWQRYCLIVDTKFSLMNRTHIDYEIKFLVIGANLPKNFYFVDAKDLDISTPNTQLLNAVVAHQKLLANKPDTVPQGISDIIQSGINEVADKIGIVTGFVDSILGDAEKIVSSAQRAVALISNARSFIAKSNRRIGKISYDANNLVPSFLNESQKASASLKNIGYIQSITASNKQLNRNLKTLQSKFESKIQVKPLRIHVVIDGDSLQKISIKYYGTPDNWNSIYKANSLRNTNLSVGRKLIIPN